MPHQGVDGTVRPRRPQPGSTHEVTIGVLLAGKKPVIGNWDLVLLVKLINADLMDNEDLKDGGGAVLLIGANFLSFFEGTGAAATTTETAEATDHNHNKANEPWKAVAHGTDNELRKDAAAPPSHKLGRDGAKKYQGRKLPHDIEPKMKWKWLKQDLLACTAASTV